jgi:receptor protein-tyrosine kinase
MSTSRPNLGADGPSVGRFGALRHHWLLITLTVTLCVAVAVIYSVTTPPRYQAQSDLQVSTNTDSTDLFFGMNVLTDPTTAPQIVGRSLRTVKVTEAVIDRLKLNTTPRDLLLKVKIAPIQQSGIVSISAKDENPELAAKIANEFPAVLIQQQTRQFQGQIQGAIDRLHTQLRTGGVTPGERLAIEGQVAQLQAFVGTPDPTLNLLSPAVVPTNAYWPRPVLSVIAALLAGLILGIGAALLLDLFDPRLTDERELYERVPVLARVPYAPRGAARRYLQGNGSLPAELWEAYRTLRASLGAYAIGEGVPKSLLVTSAIEGEGKTMTSTNLAIAMAAGGHRVILVDGDFRRSSLARAFGVDAPTQGFASLLYGSGRVEEALISSPGYGDRLRLLLVGEERPIDMLEPRRIEHVLDDLKADADIVIVDSPPVTEFADAVALADAVDIVLIAVRLGHSRRDRFDELARFLGRHGVVPAGFVVTLRRRLFGPILRRRGQQAIDEWSVAEAPEGSTETVDIR